MNRRPIFQAIRQLRGGQAFTIDEVRLIDRAIDEALQLQPVVAAPEPVAKRVSAAGIGLMHSFEGCRLAAYPDPGSRDGNPWTVGWGSTGPGISRGITWTQAQADARFEEDINKFAANVAKLVEGVATSQLQFDALCSLAYNIGVTALRGSTVLRKHKAGQYQDAARAFLMWNKNDGKVMRGLTRRRLAESDLYKQGTPT